jgi:hypothetical protein
MKKPATSTATAAATSASRAVEERPPRGLSSFDAIPERV